MKKQDKKYNIPKKSSQYKKTNVVYICSVVTMFCAVGVALIAIPKKAEPNTVPNPYAEISEPFKSSSKSSSSSRLDIRPIQSTSTGFPENPYETSDTYSSAQQSAVSDTKTFSQTVSSTNTVVDLPIASSDKVNSASAPNSSVPSSGTPSPAVSSVINNSTIPAAPISENKSGSTTFINGIAIVGNRAMSLYNPNPSAFSAYAEAVSKYKEALPNVNVYCMLIPTACEFYGSAEVNAKCASQREHINIVINALNNMRSNIKSVDAYSALAAHTNEDIYLRTDHHWAALGGYYAAEAFAKAASVPFLPLSDYEKCVNTGFVGTMYGYTNNSSLVKNNPENFVYHVPKTVDWTATYYNFKLSGSKVTGMYEPMKAAFFLNYGNNSGDNYCTFMGGDAKIVHVETSTKNGRKLAIFKESYGNPIPGYLFGSFEEIYVLDERYFPYNAVDYIKKNGITDLLFANNTVAAGNPSISAHIDANRTQANSNF